MGQSFLDEEFNYTSEQKEKILQLRKLVENNVTLKIGTEDALLSKFLNYATWQVERAYKAIIHYYDFKYKHPDWVAQRSVEYYRDHFYSTLSKFVMPKPDKFGRAVVIFKTVDAFDRYPNYIHDIVQMDDLIFESMMMLPQVQKYGVTVIYDLAGTTKNFLRKVSPTIARLINEKNNILPLTTRVVHLIQKGFIMNATSSLVMPFMSKELKEKIFSHDGKNFDKLRNMVGYDCLPAQYGGNPDNVFDVDFIYNHMLKHSEYLLKIQSYRKSIN
ncbi:retinaldehyde-binding protein 1 [Teleopsis dalmanni]|uniref:retinaldehyde-binding protein 1 n=1 Tax=Teleopsis dalmanni TaxID=139649 RepID=UPI0018CDC204|nr:retinaldehyde-binding protein 1 [Teleopsis dalmanni]